MKKVVVTQSALVGNPLRFLTSLISPAGLAKTSPPILHTVAFSGALAVPPLAKGHGFTPCLFLGIPFPSSFFIFPYSIALILSA